MSNSNDAKEAELHQRLLDGDEHDKDSQPDRAPRAHRKPMSAVERMMLSPWEKWIAHRRFPYKIMLHLLLLLLTMTQMLVYDAQNAAYMRASNRNWAFFFLPPAADIGVVPRFERELYTINRTIEALAYMRSAYFSIVNTSVANYEYPRTLDGQIYPISMQVVRVLPHSSKTEIRLYNVTEENPAIGPFTPEMSLYQQKRLMRSIRSIQFTFHLRDQQYGNFYRECFEWNVPVSLTIVEHAHVRVQVEDSEVKRCHSNYPFWKVVRQRFVWLHILVAIVSVVYMVLSIKALRRSFQMMRRARELFREHVNCDYEGSSKEPLLTESERRSRDLRTKAFGSWKEVPLALKIKLFNGLQLLVLTSLALLLLSSIWSLSYLKAHVPIHFWHRLIHGAALLLLWSCLVGYLEHNRHIYSIVLTLKWGIPRVLQFLIGVSPIFIGYALFGTIYFGNKIKAFGTLGSSMTTLFAVMNGDVILDTFDAMELHQYNLSGKIYLYSFIALFIYVVLNIFIAIVEEAFFATRSTRRMLSILVTDPQFQKANGAQETEISAEMVRVLLRYMDLQEEEEHAR